MSIKRPLFVMLFIFTLVLTSVKPNTDEPKSITKHHTELSATVQTLGTVDFSTTDLENIANKVNVSKTLYSNSYRKNK